MLAGTLEGRLLDEGPWLDVARSSDPSGTNCGKLITLQSLGADTQPPKTSMDMIYMIFRKLAGCIWEEMQRKRHYTLIDIFVPHCKDDPGRIVGQSLCLQRFWHGLQKALQRSPANMTLSPSTQPYTTCATTLLKCCN